MQTVAERLGIEFELDARAASTQMAFGHSGDLRGGGGVDEPFSVESAWYLFASDLGACPIGRIGEMKQGKRR